MPTAKKTQPNLVASQVQHLPRSKHFEFLQETPGLLPQTQMPSAPVVTQI